MNGHTQAQQQQLNGHWPSARQGSWQWSVTELVGRHLRGSVGMAEHGESQDCSAKRNTWIESNQLIHRECAPILAWKTIRKPHLPIRLQAIIAATASHLPFHYWSTRGPTVLGISIRTVLYMNRQPIDLFPLNWEWEVTRSEEDFIRNKGKPFVFPFPNFRQPLMLRIRNITYWLYKFVRCIISWQNE